MAQGDLVMTEFGVLTSQDRLEPTLLAAADAETRFGVEPIDLVDETEPNASATAGYCWPATPRTRCLRSAAWG